MEKIKTFFLMISGMFKNILQGRTWIIWIILAAVLLAGGAVAFLFLLKKRKKEEAEAAVENQSEEQPVQVKKTVPVQAVNSVPPVPAGKEEETAEEKPLSEEELRDLYNQNKDLVFLTRDYLVRDFIDLVKKYYSQEFSLSGPGPDLPWGDEKRLKDILVQLEKIERLAEDYHFRFSIQYYFQKMYYYLGTKDYHSLYELLTGARDLFPQEKDFQLYLTRLLFMLGRFDEASEELQKYLEKNPGHVPSWGLLIRCDLKLGRRASAEENCRKLIELDQSDDHKALLAHIYHLQGYVSRSESICEEILKTGDPSPRMLYYLGKVEEANGKLKDGMKKYEKAWAGGYREYEAAADLMRLNALFSRIPQAKKIMDELKKYSDLDPEIVFEYLRARKGNREDREFYKDLLLRMHGQRKTDHRLCSVVGKVLLFETKKKEAASYFDQALKLNPRHLSSLQERIKLHIDLKEFDAAQTMLDRAFGFYPDRTEFLLLSMELNYRQGNEEEGVRYREHVISKDPMNMNLYLSLGTALMRARQYQEALVYLVRAEEGSIRNQEIYNHIAYCFYALKDYDDALRYYFRALDMDQGNIETHNNIGVIYSVRKEFRKAKKYFNRALQIDPDSAETNYNLALLYKKINQENSVKHYARYKELMKAE